MKVYKTACRGCHGGCLYDVTVDNGRVIRAEPSADGPLNHGRGCAKGRSVVEQMYHPDRLTYPKKRVGPRGSGQWERITWDEAYDTIAQRVNALIDEYGPECISGFTGTGRHHLPYFFRMGNAIGSPNFSTVGGIICLGPRRTAAAMTSGLFAGVDYYGATRPGGILVWGANPAISGADGELQWFIKDAVKEGIPIVVVDPKPTELAQRAHIWLRIRPGTDGALALGILNILISEDLYDHDFVENYTHGFEELKECCKEYTLEKVSAITWIPQEKILAAAHWIATTKPLGLEQGCAFEQTVNAMDTCRAIYMIPAITGNWDVPGGFVESLEIAPAGLMPPNVLPEEVKAKALTGGHPFLLKDTMSHPYLALDAMRSEGPNRIRALFVNANNTLLSVADAQHSYDCLKELEFMVCMDLFMTPTAELADIVLPAALWPEVDCVFAMPEFGDQVLLSQQKCVQVGECKSDEEFFIELCRRAGWNYGYTDQRAMMEEQMKEMARRRPEYEDFTLDDLREQGYLAPERTYFNYKTKGFETPTGKYEFYSTAMAAMGQHPVPQWHEPPETPLAGGELSEEYPLVLTTGGRHQPFFISNNRQIKSLRKIQPFPYVHMNPTTAARYGIADGDWVYIESPRGRITQKAKLAPEMDERVVSCDFGWWYPEAGAPDYGWRESNANILTWGAPPYDPFLGSYQFRGLLCKIYPNPECTIEERYYQSSLYLDLPADDHSNCVVVDPARCLLCGECVRTCGEVQGIGALKIQTEDGITRVTSSGAGGLPGSGCVGCGQCRTVCPTGALRIRSAVEQVRAAIADPNTLVVAQVAPSVRVGVGGQLGFQEGKNSMAQLVGGLKKLGFDRVYDTAFSADLTVVEEANEFLERLKHGGALPLLTSCCPAWVKFCETRWPEYEENISTCRSPQQMLAAVIRAWFRRPENAPGKQVVVVSIMPCTAKKDEILRPESRTKGTQDVNFSLTTDELLDMLRAAGLSAADCPPMEADAPFSYGSGGGTLFGVTGGVTESVLRYLSPKLGFEGIEWIADSGVRGPSGIKRAVLDMGGRSIRIAVVSGLGHADELLRRVKAGQEEFDLIEVMACPGGCVMGGGQPGGAYEKRQHGSARSGGLYAADRAEPVRCPQDNVSMQKLWDDVICGHEHELLHRNRN